MEKIIEWTRQNIPAWTKEKLEWLELIIEKAPKILYELYEQTEKKETNKKRGRPKKEKSPDTNQTKIDTFIDLEN